VNWQSAKAYADGYENFVTNADSLASNYAASILRRQGLDPSQHQDVLDKIYIKSRAQKDAENAENGVNNGKDRTTRKDYREPISYGRGKIYHRPNDRGRFVHPQNMITAEPKGTDYYIIDNEGNIVGGKPVSIKTLQQILTGNGNNSNSSEKSRVLKDLGANDAEIANYMKDFEALRWKANDYMVDQILYMVASSKDEYHSNNISKVIYYGRDLINDYATNSAEIKIKPDQFLSIVRDEIYNKYKVKVDESTKKLFKKIVNECFKQKKQIRFTESELKQVVKEAAIKIVRDILSENRKR
jgi:hypothetical protein